MTKIQYLLTCLAEECGEVSQRATKGIRFGLDNIQDGQPLNNAERLVYEFNDMLGVLEMLREEGIELPDIGDRNQIDLKKEKVRKYMKLSEEKGIL
jgi:NTP pyrophosphatase (non-canonical NTP hydrolase)